MELISNLNYRNLSDDRDIEHRESYNKSNTTAKVIALKITYILITFHRENKFTEMYKYAVNACLCEVKKVY